LSIRYKRLPAGQRRQTVAGMVAFLEEYHLTLGPGERIQDLIHEGLALRHH
jgi:hypothetical protein